MLRHDTGSSTIHILISNSITPDFTVASTRTLAAASSRERSRADFCRLFRAACRRALLIFGGKELPLLWREQSTRNGVSQATS